MIVIDMCTHMHICMHIDMWIDLCIDMCIDMCTDAHTFTEAELYLLCLLARDARRVIIAGNKLHKTSLQCACSLGNSTFFQKLEQLLVGNKALPGDITAIFGDISGITGTDASTISAGVDDSTISRADMDASTCKAAGGPF